MLKYLKNVSSNQLQWSSLIIKSKRIACNIKTSSGTPQLKGRRKMVVMRGVNLFLRRLSKLVNTKVTKVRRLVTQLKVSASRERYALDFTKYSIKHDHLKADLWGFVNLHINLLCMLTRKTQNVLKNVDADWVRLMWSLPQKQTMHSILYSETKAFK